MDFKQAACEELRKYNITVVGIENLINRIHEIEMSTDGLGAMEFDKERVQGSGGNAMETHVINSLSELNMLRPALDIAMGKKERIDKALRSLSEQQRIILDRFHINRPVHHVQTLCAELGYEKSQVYQLYNEAIRDYTIAMYAIVDA